MVLRWVFGSTRDKVTGECRRLHKEELFDLYISSKYYSWDQIKKNEVDWACSTNGRQER
jgi:hypothetical protein